MKELRFKPCKQMHLSVLIFVIIIATCISELIAIIYFNGWTKFLYVNLGIFGFDLFSIGFYLFNEKLSEKMSLKNKVKRLTNKVKVSIIL